MGSGEQKRACVRGREVTLLGGKVYGRSDREVAALVLVEDASEDGGGVEIGNAVGLDWTGGDESYARIRIGWGAPEPSELTWRGGLGIKGQEKGRRAVVAHHCGRSHVSNAVGRGRRRRRIGEGNAWWTHRPWSAIAV